METRERPSDARLVERVAHYLLSEKRIKGEWFNVTTAEAIDAVQLAIQQIDDGVVTYDSFKGKSTRNTVLIDRVARDAAIGIRTTPTIKRMADEAAQADRRTTSQWIENLIVEAWKRSARRAAWLRRRSSLIRLPTRFHSSANVS